jgi:hypothetical protein
MLKILEIGLLDNRVPLAQDRFRSWDKNHKSSILVAKSVLLRECSKLHKGGFALGVALSHPNEKTAAN